MPSTGARDPARGTTAPEAVVQDAVAQREDAVRGRIDAEARTRLVVDQAPDAYCSVDEAGGVVDWNPAAERTFGWSRDEVLGRDIGEVLLSARRSALHRAQVADFRVTRTSSILGRHLDVPMTRRDGALLRVDCVVWSVVDPAGHATLHTFMSDVTGRRDAADDLRRANDDLNAFSAAMAHDLRTPLTSVKGLAQLLELELSAAGRVDLAPWAARIDAAADRGVELIEGVLRFLGVGRAPLSRSPVDLTVLVGRAARDQVAASDRAAEVDVRPLPVVRGDAQLLTQLFDNLIGNALKHVPGDRMVVIVVEALPEDPDGTVVVRVRDNGDPVAAADRDRIFDLFGQGSRTPVSPGSGVGLAVSRRIAELHHGGVELEARSPGPLGGNAFVVRLGA